MAITRYEITWLLSLLRDMDMHWLEPVTLLCDNQATLHIGHNPILHEPTKHIEVDWYHI